MSIVALLATAPPLERQTLGDQVYRHIRQLLIAGKLTPGDRLSLRSVADALGVSMMPVREAVSRLVADQALEVTPNRAVRVPIMNAQQFRQLATIREEIEGFAAAQAACVRHAGRLLDIEAAEARFSAIAAEKNPDRAAAVEANQAFHFAVYAASEMPDLVEIIGGLWLKVGPVINLDLRENPERISNGSALPLHRRALAAIRSGDASAARQAIAEDIRGAADFILSQKRLPDIKEDM